MESYVSCYFNSTPGGNAVGPAREIRESFRRIQQARREADVEVLQTLLELMSILAEDPIAAPFQKLLST